MGEGSLVLLAAMELVDLPPLFLARPAIGGHAQGAVLALLRRLLAAGDAGGGFGIQGLGLGGTTTHPAEGLDHHAALVEAIADQQFVTDLGLLAWLAALAAAMHLAPLDGGLGPGPGLVEPRGPQR